MNRPDRRTARTRRPQRGDTDLSVPTPAPTLVSTGGVVAHDQVAQWVRFADTKATILSAALGVVTTLLVTRLHLVAHQIHDNHGTGRLILTSLATITVAAFAAALLNLIKTISPRTDTDVTLNRFAWPSLATHTNDEIRQHVRTADPDEEIWDQIRLLSVLAGRKFAALRAAIFAFAVYVSASVATLVVAIIQGL